MMEDEYLLENPVFFILLSAAVLGAVVIGILVAIRLWG